MSKTHWCHDCQDYGFGCAVAEALKIDRTEPKPDCFDREREPWDSYRGEEEPELQTQEPGGQSGFAFEGDQLALGI